MPKLKSVIVYWETSLTRNSMGLERSVGLGGCQITEWPLAYFNIVTVPYEMVRLERMSDCTVDGRQITEVHYSSTSCLGGT